MKNYITLVLAIVACGCKHAATKTEQAPATERYVTTKMYAPSVGDTFFVSVSVPTNYDRQKRYPVVYVLDANLYFDILATTLNKYSPVGLAPEVILVGIGYKDFQTMDSLRDRDYTYPAAMPQYEMSVSGGANKFLSFISGQLMPEVDKMYPTDTAHRVLMGHSLGGYFTAYALLQQLQGKYTGFSSYIAASPSVVFDKCYWFDQMKNLGQQAANKNLKAYFTFGGLEDDENKDEPEEMNSNEVLTQSNSLLANKLSFKTELFSNLGHMDAQMPAFIKGLRWVLSDGK
ncbi:MAG: alpha/beta hydrolase [Flavipsychrobacter sp.]